MRTHLELWPEPLPEGGSLADVSVAMLLARARLLRVTGVLGLRGERFVYLLRGLPVFVDSILQVDASDVYLVKAGLLRDRALEAVRAQATEQGSGVGEALLQMGVVTPSELFEHKREHTRQRLVDCMAWRDGTARFEERPFGSEIVPIPVDLAQVLADGVAEHYDARRLARELPVGEAHRVYLAGPPDAGRGLTLAPLESRLLSRASSRPSLATLAMDLRLEHETLHRGLFVLYHLGLVGFELSGEPHEPRLEPSDVIRPPHLAAPRAGAPRRIPSPAPMAAPALRPPHPSPAPTSSVDRGQSPAGRRQLSPLGKPTRSAAGYLEDAELARDAGNLEAALLALRYAHALEPDNATITSELALAFLEVDDKAFAREAGRLARDARRQNPSLPLPYVVLGILMEQLRDYTRAAQLYKHALSRDPGCEHARLRLERLVERRNAR